MASAAQSAGVQLVTGDTKVVNRGKGDKVFITTTGIGVVDRGTQLSADRARPGDKILLSGYIGDHGITILSQREDLEFESALRERLRGAERAGEAMLDAAAGAVEGFRVMRDPTRGGVATVLNEIAGRSRVGMVLRENEIPVRESVRGACEMLGLDPLYVANEGKLVAIVAPEIADRVLAAMQRHPLGAESCDDRRGGGAARRDGADEDVGRRNTGRRRAVRRTVAAHLLTHPGSRHVNRRARFPK